MKLRYLLMLALLWAAYEVGYWHHNYALKKIIAEQDAYEESQRGFRRHCNPCQVGGPI